MKGTDRVWEGKYLFQAEVFETRNVNCLNFSLREVTGWACLGSKVTVAVASFDMLQVIENIPVGDSQTLDLSTVQDEKFQVIIGDLFQL